MRRDAPKPRPRLRVCAACERDDGNDGPRPTGSQLKLVGGVMTYACSAECARKLGWRGDSC